MKKFFHAVLVLPLVLFAAACSDDEGPKSVELTGGTKPNQTVYADDKTPAPIQFTAKAAWTATVAEVQTKAEGGSKVDWLTLNTYSGEAGPVSLAMTLSPNYTGQDRKAEIRIVCAGTTIKITVEQKGTKQDGNKPKPTPDQPTTDLKNRIMRIDEEWFGKPHQYYEFSYDEVGRVVGIKAFEYADDEYGDTEYNITVTYGDKTITYENKGEGKDNGKKYIWTCTDTAVLDENGRVVSEKITSAETTEEGTSTDEIIYRFTYDNGYLVKTEELDPDPDCLESSYQITWTDGNPTKVVDYYRDNIGENSNIDRATYGTVENKANLDLNWIALCSESWHFSVGENQFLAMTGYMGKRSKNMAETVITHCEDKERTYTDTNEYQFDSEGRIIKIISKDDDGNTDVYTIRYAE